MQKTGEQIKQLAFQFAGDFSKTMDPPCLPSSRAASSASAAAPLTLMKRRFGRLISLPFVLINEAALARPQGSVK